MTPQHWPEPINEMLSAIDRRDGTLWAMPIVSALELQSAGSALDIAITALTAQLPGLGDERAALAERWLADLNAMKGANVDPATVGSLSRDIWFHSGSRDETQTAIARLYAALSNLKAKSDLGYRREVAMALAVGMSDPDGRPNADRLRHLIDLFVQVIQ
jgi:hypothetical protein